MELDGPGVPYKLDGLLISWQQDNPLWKSQARKLELTLTLNQMTKQRQMKMTVYSKLQYYRRLLNQLGNA